MEKTLLLIKPDGVHRRLVGEVISRFEKKGLQLVGIKMLTMDDELLAEHYSHLIAKPFFREIAEFMKVSPIIATCWAGLDAVATVRGMCGVTEAREAVPGTIRGDLAMSIQTNIVHASDSKKAATDEVRRFFREGELFEYEDYNARFIYSQHEQSG
jgi:nucleoside-diphosphate kinase